MIEISISLAFSLYLALFLFTTLTLWIVFHKKREKKMQPRAFFKLYVCSYCHFPYLDETYKPVTKCPQCKLFNK